jgi:flagellar protein FliO/FliZ
MLLTIEGYSGYTNLLDLVGMIIMFVVIIIACYFVTRFIGSRQIKAQKKSNFKVIDVMRLQGGKLLEIVAIGNRFFCYICFKR